MDQWRRRFRRPRVFHHLPTAINNRLHRRPLVVRIITLRPRPADPSNQRRTQMALRVALHYHISQSDKALSYRIQSIPNNPPLLLLFHFYSTLTLQMLLFIMNKNLKSYSNCTGGRFQATRCWMFISDSSCRNIAEMLAILATMGGSCFCD